MEKCLCKQTSCICITTITALCTKNLYKSQKIGYINAPITVKIHLYIVIRLCRTGTKDLYKGQKIGYINALIAVKIPRTCCSS